MSEGNLFGDLDVNSAADNPWVKPDGPYHCFLTKVESNLTKKGDKYGMNLEYTIQDGPKARRKIKEWKWIPTPNQLAGYKALKEADNDEESPDEEFAGNAADAVAWLKARMKDFGIPSDRINTVNRQDLLDMGLDLTVTIRTKNGNEQITSVMLYEGDDVNDPFAS